jgi:hypothetical protein
MLRERAIMLLDMLYTFEAGRYNSDVIARSNGFVVNAQIIEPRSLSPDISIRPPHQSR